MSKSANQFFRNMRKRFWRKPPSKEAPRFTGGLRKGMIKNIAILLIVILTFIQTDRLWFGSASSSGLFTSFFSPGNIAVDSAALQSLSKPCRLIANRGGNTFAVRYTDIQASVPKQQIDKAMQSLFAEGSFVGARTLDWRSLLPRSGFILEYRFDMPSEAFTESYGQKMGLLTSRLKNFQHVVICPEDKGVAFVFADDTAQMGYEFNITDENQSRQLLLAMDAMATENPGLYYFATSLIGSLDSQLFADNVFVPKWAGEVRLYPNVLAINPYMEGGGLLIDKVEKKIDVFFDSPSAIRKHPIDTGSDKIYNYNDANTVVKYYPSGVLEYDNYKAYGGQSAVSFATAYAVAVAFAQRDPVLINDFYLEEYTVDGNEWVLYFDFTIQGFPIILSEAASQAVGMSHPLEITVVNGHVTKYKHYAFNYEAVEPITAAGLVSYQENIQRILPANTENSMESAGFIRGLGLVYSRIDSNSPYSLFWRMTMENSAITLPAVY